MKDTLKRLFGQAPEAPAQADNQTEEKVEMTKGTNEGLGLAAEMTDTVAALTATVSALTEQLAAKVGEVAALTAQVEAAVEFKAAQAAAAAEAKAAARLAALVGAVGTEAASGLMAATASMEDTAFDAVLAAVSLKTVAESASPAFKEVGVEGNADASKLSAEAVSGNRVLDYLKTVKHEKSDLVN